MSLNELNMNNNCLKKGKNTFEFKITQKYYFTLIAGFFVNFKWNTLELQLIY